MSRIAIIKVRSAHDVEWQLPRTLDLALGLGGLVHLRNRLRAAQGVPFVPQLTLPYLAALGQRYNERHGTAHEFVLIDEPAGRIRLRRDEFDMAWLTAVTPTAPAAYRISDAARRQGIVTVLGGIHVSTLPEEAARHADAVVVGEGEDVVHEILADFDRTGAVRPRYEGGRSAALETLPVPRWRDAVVRDYCPWVVPVQTSRGCRNACHFCSTTRYQGAPRRHRPIPEVVAEIRALQQAGVLTPDKTVFFTDNNIVSDTDHRRGVRDTRYARALFEALAPLRIQWVGQGEINVGDDPELVALMARAGCIDLLVGFESVRQGSLDGVGKPSNHVERYAAQIETLHRHGVAIIGCFIFGMDSDGPGVFAETRAFIERYIDIPQVTLLTPFPGTALHRRLQREGRLLHEDWSRYDATRVVFRPARMSVAALAEGYADLVREIYSYPAALGRAARYAMRRIVPGGPDLSLGVRLSSVLTPNLVYRFLCGANRDEVAPRPWDALDPLPGLRTLLAAL